MPAAVTRRDMLEGTTAAPLRVLIIDDEKNIRATLRLCLEDLGAHVFEAPSAESARALALRQDLDLAFVDLRLGPTNGLALLPPLLAQNPLLEIVVITASALSPLAGLADVRFEIVESDFGSFRSLSATFCLAMTLARVGSPATPRHISSAICRRCVRFPTLSTSGASCGRPACAGGLRLRTQKGFPRVPWSASCGCNGGAPARWEFWRRRHCTYLARPSVGRERTARRRGSSKT